MAIVFSDSVDHYTTVTGKYPTIANSPFVNAGTGRHGASLRMGSTDGRADIPTLTPAPSGATAIAGMAIKISDISKAHCLFAFMQGGSLQMEARITAAGLLTVTRNGTVLGTSAAALVANRWTYVELKVVINPSTGTYELRVDGANVVSGTGANTRATGSSTWDGLRLGDTAFTGSFTKDYDDIYFLDGSGSFNNDFLGDVRVDAYVTTANGNTSGSTPSTGTNRALNVDDAAPNGDTDYNTLAASGDKDTLVLTDLSPAGVGTVLGFQVLIYAAKTDAGAGSVCPVIRSGGTDYDGTATALSTTYGYARVPYDTNPATGVRMTESEFNAAELGYKRTA